MVPDLSVCPQEKRVILYLSIFAFIGQAKVQHDNGKISMYHIVIFRKKVILVLIKKRNNTMAQIDI